MRENTRSAVSTGEPTAATTALLAGPHLLFPGNALYARQYFTTQRSGGDLAYTWSQDSELERVVTVLSGEEPPCVNRVEVLARLPEKTRLTLLEKEKVLVLAMRRAFPPLEGEHILGEYFTVLSEPWALAPEGALVYLRRSNFGSMMIVDGTKIVSAVDGDLRLQFFAAPRPVFRLPDAVAGRSVLGGKISTIKSVLSIVQMMLFAFGPAGVIIAGGIGVLELIFGSGEEKLDLPKVINDLVVQDFANDHVKTDLATIVGYAQWLSEQNASVLSGQMPGKSAKGYADTVAQLKAYVVNACDPGSQLMTAVSNLQNGDYTSDPPFPVLGLPAFLLGASLHLIFEKARLLFSTDATTFHSPLVSNIVNVASDYVSYIDKTLDVIDSAFSERIDGISGPIEGNFTESAAGGGKIVNRKYAYITDSAAPKFPSQDIQVPSTGGHSSGYANNVVWYNVCWPKGCSTTGTCDDDDFSSGRDWKRDYIGRLKSKIAEKYNADDTRRAELIQARAGFQKIIDTYKAAVPTG